MALLMRKYFFIINSLILFLLLFLTQCAEEVSDVETTEGATKVLEEKENGEEITIEHVESSYDVASGETSGFFNDGQEADLLLSGVDFDNTGGPLFFNHQTGIATDGTHLVLADRNNNRVLIWSSLPEGNEEPDIVLGQKDFSSNAPGDGLDELNWPVALTTDGTHLAIADTYNDRILIWNSWPTQNGQAADLVLSTPGKTPGSRGGIKWPWGVWTNGEKFVVSSTAGSQLLIWNEFPSEDNQEPDIVLMHDDIGTPRNIMSDGTNLAVGDHNALDGSEHGTFFWSSFPTEDDQEYDFYIADPNTIGKSKDTPPGIKIMGAEILGGAFTEAGAFIVIANSGLFIWNKFPVDEDDAPDLSITGFDFGAGESGDGSGIAVAGEEVYVSLSNGNRVVVFNEIPTDALQEPDFVIGAPDIYTNTYASNYFITNPVPVSDGEHLFVSSDFDKTLSVWKALPDESNVHPDIVYHNVGGWDNALYGETFVIVGGKIKDTLYIWNELPLGQQPDKILQKQIGSVRFQGLAGVALDEKYLYVADERANKIYVWEGIPEEDDEPVYTLESNAPTRLSSDGTYLVATRTDDNSIDIYTINDLEEKPITLGGQGKFNRPNGVEISEGSLFIADTGNNYVHIWKDVEDALAGKDPDILLGVRGVPQIGKDTLFWPAVPSYDGSYLWLGEFKFSGRLLRFSPEE